MSNNLTPSGADPIVGTLDDFNKTCQQALDSGKQAVEKFKSVAITSNWSALKSTDISIDELLKTLDIYDEGFGALSNGAAITSVVKESHPEESFRTAAEQREQEIEKATTEYSLDRDLYDTLQALNNLAGDRFDEQTRHYVEKTLRDFRRAGVDKDEETRKKVKALNEELVRVGQEFSRNIRDDARFVEVDPDDLNGLPEDYIKSHKPGDNGKIKITTDYPDYVPFVTYSRSVKAREALWRIYRKRGYPKNIEVLQRLISLRHELATLLGYKSWAAYVTEDKMIKSEKNAAEFIEKIANAARARRDRDYEALLERKRVDEPDAQSVNPWEQAYLEDRIKAEKYSSDSQAVRPYFEYTRVKKGVLDTCGKLFGISFKKLENAKVLHPDVEAYDLLGADGKLLGRFYLDMHPRDGKYKHAAQFSLVNGKSGVRLPEAVLMCNFPKPSEDPSAEPALMLHNDVETFFHEFGHLLHHILGGHTKWSGLSGVRTEWDFVETPSQMLEEWTKNASVLQTFALHYQTNEPIPTDLVKKLKTGDEFGKGVYVSQQMFYAAVSLNYYNREDNAELDTTAMLKELQEKYTTFKYVEDTYFQLSFGHLDGYSAIYYTYMWSLVIAKDLFEQFEKVGLMNAEIADRYRRCILEPGGSKDAALLVRDFLGRDYSFDAYERWLNQPLE